MLVKAPDKKKRGVFSRVGWTGFTRDGPHWLIECAKKAKANKEQAKKAWDGLFIRIYHLSTHQGRKTMSSNGCTVIATLAAQKHAKNGYVSDKEMEDIIDNISGPIAKEIREKNNIHGHYGYLSLQEALEGIPTDGTSFTGVAGGNVTNEGHLDNFLKLLSEGEQGNLRDVATSAAFLFNGHTVNVSKYVSGTTGDIWYEINDSLGRMSDENGIAQATRTRCRDLDILRTVLLRYACSQLDQEVFFKNYGYEIDLLSAEEDPRTFQAFVWNTKPTIRERRKLTPLSICTQC